MDYTLKLNELLIARLCHDLAGQVGAMHNSLELLRKKHFEGKDDLLDLLAGCSKASIARINYYRYTYGPCVEDKEADLAEIRDLIEQMYENNRIEVIWLRHYSQIMVPLRISQAKVLLNLIISATDLCVYEGKITIALIQRKGYKGICLTIKGGSKGFRNIAVFEQMLLLSSDTEELDCSCVQFYLTAKLIAAAQATIRLEQEKNSLQIIVEWAEEVQV